MVLQNYVTLESGVPKRLHFAAGALVSREITDPLTKQAKTVRTLQFVVDQVDGRPEPTTFSVTAERLAAMLAPYLSEDRYRLYDFIITRIGEGFRTRYDMRVEAHR